MRLNEVSGRVVAKWCNTHQRPSEECINGGGIMIPCQHVDLTGIAEIERYETTVVSSDTKTTLVSS